MLRTRSLFYVQRRWKGGKTHWNVQQRKKTNTDRALQNFDDFYGSVYGLRWRNMRAALLTEHKYIAMVNNFGDTEKTCSLLEMDGAINVKALVQLAKDRLAEAERVSVPQIAPDAKNNWQMENRLEDMIRQREQEEKQALYPEGKEQLEREASSSDSDDEQHRVDPKKSLGDVLTDDMQLDYTRLVDVEKGNTGALYDFVPANRIKGREDWLPESEHYKYYPTSTDFPLKVVAETDFKFPEHLHLYTYEMGNCSLFQSPRKCLTGVLSHYLMDGASILPPLCLDVQLGEHVLDACAAPGGKALLMLQTLHPAMLVCNDVQESRMNRVRSVMQEYLFDYKERWVDGDLLRLQQCDARNLDDYGLYDKILVDVPCTTDRHALNKQDNNIFKPTRVKERLRIPELQAGILTNCLRLLRPGGSLVYSTCTLSPVQNDGVVHMALQQAFTEHGITATIKDLSWVTRLFGDIFKFEQPQSLKYGQLVVPYLPANFGPMYFSKITRDAP